MPTHVTWNNIGFPVKEVQQHIHKRGTTTYPKKRGIHTARARQDGKHHDNARTN